MSKLNKVLDEMGVATKHFTKFREANLALTKAVKTAYEEFENILVDLKNEGMTNAELTKLRTVGYSEIKSAYMDGLE